MAKELILHGIVQGVFCRAYCSQYAKKLRIRGSASNLYDGTVRVLLDTDNIEHIKKFINSIKNNPGNFTFYGRIDNVEVDDYSGRINGDYQF